VPGALPNTEACTFGFDAGVVRAASFVIVATAWAIAGE
jgi:hypothetical protein